MRVGVWARDLSDDGLRFYKQIGVDDIDVHLRLLAEFRDTGQVQSDTLSHLKDSAAAHGLRIELVNFDWPHIHLVDAYLGKPGAERQIDNLCATILKAGRAGIPLVGVQVLTAYWPSEARLGRYIDTGRGGYRQNAFNWDHAIRDMDSPIGLVDADQLWEGYFRVFSSATAAAEEARVRLTIHGNDPPIPEYRGIPYVLRSFAAFDRLFSAVPSDRLGMTYCVGTRHESGEDVFEGIRRFGEAGRIFHVHFRNVVGQIPRDHFYKEVYLDEGEVDMGAVVQALRDVSFDGVLNVDHVPIIDGDTPDLRMATSWSVAYTKALVAASNLVRS